MVKAASAASFHDESTLEAVPFVELWLVLVLELVQLVFSVEVQAIKE